MNNNDLTFGKRLGFESTDFNVQLESIDNDLKNDLYNSFIIFVMDLVMQGGERLKPTYRRQFQLVWVHFFRYPLDKFPRGFIEFRGYVKHVIYKDEWFRAYELFEFLFNSLDSIFFKVDELIDYVNEMLERNHSGYRIMNRKFIPIINNLEISEIEVASENASKANIFGFNEHLNASMDLLSKKPTPDFRNSIKESISMVEAVSRAIEPDENTLGKALKKLDKDSILNPTLKSAFEKLYAYSNGKGGIRHALMTEHNLDMADARFFLISCSAFSNYLIDKGRKFELIKEQ